MAVQKFLEELSLAQRVFRYASEIALPVVLDAENVRWSIDDLALLPCLHDRAFGFAHSFIAVRDALRVATEHHDSVRTVIVSREFVAGTETVCKRLECGRLPRP